MLMSHLTIHCLLPAIHYASVFASHLSDIAFKSPSRDLSEQMKNELRVKRVGQSNVKFNEKNYFFLFRVGR